MSRQPSESGPGPVPCAANPAAGPARYVHPEGVCACFRGGPAPVQVLTADVAVLAERPGVFDSAGVDQLADSRRRHPSVRGRVRALLRRLRDH